VVLLQRKVDDKFCEISAIPELLEALGQSGTVVTTGATSCQKTIPEKIVAKKSATSLWCEATAAIPWKR
jgi:predicted transposase YbfD/YdcC